MEPGPSTSSSSFDSYQNSPEIRYKCANPAHPDCGLNMNPVIFHSNTVQTKNREHYFRVFFLFFFVIECLRLMLATWMVLEESCPCPSFLQSALSGFLQAVCSVILIGFALSDYNYRWLALFLFVLIAVAGPFLSDMLSLGKILSDIDDFFSDPKNKVMYFLGYAMYGLLGARWIYFGWAIITVVVYFSYLFLKNRRSYEDLEEEE